MKPSTIRTLLSLALAFWGVVLPGRPDVLIGTNGERFAGRVVDETADAVVFDSELGGRLTIPRSRIQELQRTAPSQPSALPHQASTLSAPATNAAASTNLAWRPPGVGLDRSDWLQLKSGEWLKGRLRYVQDRKVEFDSDELKDQSLDLKDVRQLYPANPLFIKFNDRDEIYGKVVVSNDVVEVVGPEQVSLPRDQLMGITPGGKREIDFWSGNLSLGLSLQSGNTRQATLSTSAELVRRTPSTVGRLNYLGNYAEAEGVQNANNQRVTGTYDIRLNRRWFLRPAYLEYYQDELANIAHQGTLGVELGYYIFDRQGLEWNISGGPGYQRTQYKTVEPGQADTVWTPAGVLQTYFKADITRRLKFTQTIGIALTTEEAGRYSHHAVSTLEFEIKRHVDLDVSWVWDYLQNPQATSSGVLPQQSDFRLTVGVGVKF
jgi:hypothetical protein